MNSRSGAAVRQAAEAFAASGLSIIPIKPDGSKKPLVPWKEYQSRIAGPAERAEWWGNGSHAGLAILCGPVSGNLEALDFDDVTAFDEWAREARQMLPDVAKQLVVTETPGPGRQVLYRLQDAPEGNQVLARDRKGGVRVETRGSGGYIIAPPSGPQCHPNGKPYVLRRGRLTALPVLTPDERALLLSLARALDETPAPEARMASAVPPGVAPLVSPHPPLAPPAFRPGDDFNRRGDHNALLTRHGWTLERATAEGEYWRRPGKDEGHSATWDIAGPSVFCVFSSNAAPFEGEAQGTGYDLFGMLARLEYGGDFEAATRALAAAGYGEPAGVRAAGQAAPPAAVAPPLPVGDFSAAAYRTDLGNCLRLTRDYHNRLRHAYGEGWLAWSGKHWQPDRLEDARNCAKATARDILAEARLAEDAEEAKRLAAWSFSSQSAGHVAGMLDLAKSEPALRCEITDFDADPYLFNCANGTLDLRTGQLFPHRREDMISNLSPIEFDPAARFDPWNEFLDELTGGDAEFVAFLRRAVGYSLSGDCSEGAIFFALGPTGTGKSTFLAALDAALGSYAASAGFETFLVRAQVGSPRPDLARLRGKRLVTSVETERGRRFATGLMKQLSGDDKLTCRFLFRQEFEYRPEFKVWLAANDAPEAPHEDEAFWRRLYRLPFTHRPRHPNRHLKARLRVPADAGAAILAWAFAGFQEWQQHGLGQPEAIRAATAAYRTSMDPLDGFFPDYLRREDEGRVSAAQIREAYSRFCMDENIRDPLSAKKLLKSLAERGLYQVHTKSGNLWQGAVLATDSLFAGKSCD